MATHEDILNLEDPSHINPAAAPVLPPHDAPKTKKVSGGKKISPKMLVVGGIVLAAIITAGVVFYMLTRGVQKEDVEFQFSGPDTVKSGEEVTIKIGYANNNGRITMQNTKLTLSVPKGFEYVSSSLTPQDQGSLTWDLGEVAPKTQQILEVHAKLYGDLDSTVKISGALTFTPSSLSKELTANADYSPSVVSPKISLDLDAPEKLDAGGQITYKLDITNNESTNYENAAIKFSLPKGFTALPTPEGTTTTDAPKYDKDSDTWKLGSMSPAQKKTITLLGRLDGASDEQQEIGVQLLLTKDGVNYVQEEASKVTVISSPSLSLTQTSSTETTTQGTEIKFLLTVKNTGSSALTNLALSEKLDSKVINPASLRIDSGGVFKDSTVSWDNTVVSNLKLLNPNQEFKIGFSLTPYKDITATGKEFSIIATPKITTGTQEVIGNVLTVKIKTTLDITSSVSPFDADGNPLGTGPTTPTVGQTTKYRLSFSITNKYNTLQNAKLVCNIPLGATYAGTAKTNPGQVVFDSTLKNAVWTIGTLNAKTEGTGTPTATGYFDVSVTPTAPNKGTALVLAKNCVVSGHDSFVNQDITVTLKTFATEKVQ